jgi:hypothetical protein
MRHSPATYNMTPQRADKLIVAGFVAAYAGVMSAVMVRSIPALEAASVAIIAYALLPLTALGIGIVIVGNILYPPRDIFKEHAPREGRRKGGLSVAQTLPLTERFETQTISWEGA